MFLVNLLPDILACIRFAFLPTLLAVIKKPTLLLHPHALSRIFMAHAWNVLGDGIDSNSVELKTDLITRNAEGVVLELGAGHGHTLKYLDKNRVTKYIALEPNDLMHPFIRDLGQLNGFRESDGTLLILSCTADELLSAHSSLQVDTLVSILTLCTIPNAQTTVTNVVTQLLKPHTGQFLYYEHVLSPRSDVAWWQKFWSPIWSLFLDGCRLDKPTHLWVERMGLWDEEKSRRWGLKDEPEDHPFWHQIGRYIRK